MDYFKDLQKRIKRINRELFAHWSVESIDKLRELYGMNPCHIEEEFLTEKEMEI